MADSMSREVHAFIRNELAYLVARDPNDMTKRKSRQSAGISTIHPLICPLFEPKRMPPSARALVRPIPTQSNQNDARRSSPRSDETLAGKKSTTIKIVKRKQAIFASQSPRRVRLAEGDAASLTFD